MLRKTEGIVLKTTPFGEADLIVTCLTKDYGIIKTFAKSPRKVKSRFGSSLEPLTHAHIAFWGKEDATLPRLTQADIINSFQTIRNSMSCYLRVSEIVELTLNFVPERESVSPVYALFINTLFAMELNCESVLQVVQYKVKLLHIVGYLPQIDSCGRCGTKGDAFYVSHGTVLCGNCSAVTDSAVRISPGVRNLFSSLVTWIPKTVSRIRPSAILVAELSTLLDDHVKYITERTMKTKSFNIN